MNPETARSLWRRLLDAAPANEIAGRHLQAIINSVLVDGIAAKMETSDEFAVVIGRRIDMLIQASQTEL